MNKRLFIKLKAIVTVIILLISCSTESTNQEDNKVLKVDPEVLTISSFIKYVKNIRLIPLETRPDALIGSVVKVAAFNDRFYIMDSHMSNSVFIFNNKGGVISSIHSEGKGPAEYTRIADIAIDPFKNELIICDSSLKKILKYDIDGNFISELKFDFMPMSVGFVDPNTYAFKTMNNWDPVVITTNHKGKNQKTVHTGIFEFNLITFSQFPHFNSRQLYTEYLNDTIYTINKNGADQWKYIDFLAKKITKSDQKELINWSRENKWIPRVDKTQAGGITVYLETDDKIQIGCQYQGQGSIILINKDDNQQVMIKKKAREVDPLVRLFYDFRTTDDAGRIIGVFNSTFYQGLFDNDEFNLLLKNGIVEIEEKGFKDQSKVNIESNNIITVLEIDFPEY